MMGERYDRQLRLWGGDGQQALTSAHVLVIGATTTAAEMLKNMILTGIGLFTIVDDAIIDDDSMGNNFFLTTDDYVTKRPIAKALVQHLSELNTQTIGIACVESCVSWVDTFLRQGDSTCGSASLQRQPTLIAVTPRLPAEAFRRLSAYVRDTMKVPLIYVQAVGLVGLIQVQERERLIIHAEPKPETRVADLRIFNPFPALRKWFDTHDPGNETLFREDPEKHSHLPWITILYHALQRIRQERGEPKYVPHVSADYELLRRAVAALIRRPHPPQEGFMEAMKMCRTVLNRPSTLPLALQTLLEDPRVIAPSRVKQTLMGGIPLYCWVILHGIKRFIDANDGVPPFCGYVPDISTTTEWYEELRVIYVRKMDADCEAVRLYALDELKRCGTECDACAMANVNMIEDLTRALVQNLWTLQLVKFHSDIDLYGCDVGCHSHLKRYLSDCSTTEEQFTVELYAALLAARYFEELYGRPPGCAAEYDMWGDAAWVADADKLLQIVGVLRGKQSDLSDLTTKACMEMSRFGAGEPAATACIVGAAAAQECIKLIQKRRIPVQRPLLYDGYRGCFWLASSVEDNASSQVGP